MLGGQQRVQRHRPSAAAASNDYSWAVENESLIMDKGKDLLTNQNAGARGSHCPKDQGR